MMNHLEDFFEDETSILFGGLGKLRRTATLINPEDARELDLEILRMEHALLIAFVWFVMTRENDYTFLMPKDMKVTRKTPLEDVIEKLYDKYHCCPVKRR